MAEPFLCAAVFLNQSRMLMVAAIYARKSTSQDAVADEQKSEAELSTMIGEVSAGPYIKNLDRALRGLDR